MIEPADTAKSICFMKSDQVFLDKIKSLIVSPKTKRLSGCKFPLLLASYKFAVCYDFVIIIMRLYSTFRVESFMYSYNRKKFFVALYANCVNECKHLLTTLYLCCFYSHEKVLQFYQTSHFAVQYGVRALVVNLALSLINLLQFWHG